MPRPSAQGLTYVAPVLRVADLAHSLTYDRDRLGFAVEFEYGGLYAGILRDDCRVHLKCSPPPQRDRAAFEVAERLDACFGVRDAETLAARVASAGGHGPHGA
jgi:hypothetical protein